MPRISSHLRSNGGADAPQAQSRIERDSRLGSDKEEGNKEFSRNELTKNVMKGIDPCHHSPRRSETVFFLYFERRRF